MVVTTSQEKYKVQVNVHVREDNATLLALVKTAKELSIPACLMGEAAMEIAWQHFPNEVKALAQKKNESRVNGPSYIKQLQLENAQLKQRLGLS